MHLEKFRLNHIQNGPLSAIIYFHMPYIVLMARPLLSNKMWVFGGGCTLKFLNYIEFEIQNSWDTD